MKRVRSCGGPERISRIRIVHRGSRTLILYHTLSKAVCNPLHQSINVEPVYYMVRPHVIARYVTPFNEYATLIKARGSCGRLYIGLFKQRHGEDKCT